LPNPQPGKYPTLSKDARLTALIDLYNTRAAPLALREIGKITTEIVRQPNESGESGLGDLIADAHLEATRSAGAQLAFMNHGGIRADLRAERGVVTYNDLFSVHPFGNGLITLSLTGEQIDALLEQQWLQSDGTLQVSAGFYYEWSAAAPAGQKVDIGRIRLQGEPIDAKQVYRVTVNEFLAEGGAGFVMLKRAPERVRGIVDLEALERYVAAHSPIGAPPGGRIVRRD
jgi:5'-nucleotidase